MLMSEVTIQKQSNKWILPYAVQNVGVDDRGVTKEVGVELSPPPPLFSYFFHFCILISFLFYVKERDERANFN